MRCFPTRSAVILRARTYFNKEALFEHLQQRYGELFQETFDFLFYDITSAYFEGSGEKNPMEKRGCSPDGRPD